MGLSRLENFLRSIRGNIIYVDPNSLDATDSIENTGSALTRPFKTIQRALIEAARFSYLPGPDNDKFANTTILVYPGEHLIDNRPGWIPEGEGAYLLRNGQSSSDFFQFDLQTNFDITTENNALYKFNSVHGGVIVPRGTSIVGMDLRKTKIRPKYVPNPENDNIGRSAIFRLTGACYLWQLSIFDGNPSGTVYKDYTNNVFTPTFSHNKLTVFEYADGVNNISINDGFLDYYTPRTDLDVYYQKLGLAYGNSSGRTIVPDYPDADIDVQTKIDEFRIVGSRGEEVGISSIFSGDGVTPSETITVVLESEVEGLDVDTPIGINGVSISGYNGQYIVGSVLSSTEIRFDALTAPIIAQGGSGGTLSIVSDTVTSASPYIFNCSLRSVYGMCGLHADGNSVEGFRSMVVAQFTGISLQKDNNAFVKYDQTTGKYIDSTNVANIYSDSLARYKPSYESYHIKASNNAFIQCVSIFAIGYAQHFEADTGGDQSITNSNSNFGAKALLSRGFRGQKFIRDDTGYITHIIPPKKIENELVTIEFDAIDADTTLSVGNPKRLYLFNQKNINNPPISVIDGYRIGAKSGDKLYVTLNDGVTYDATIVMDEVSQSTYEKSYDVRKQVNGISNEISSNVITLTADHQLINGESIRISSDTGQLPDNVESNKIYYAITNTTSTGIGNSEIKLASSLNDALNGSLSSASVNIYSNETSNLKVVSRVSDKRSGDYGHPIKYDSTVKQWYLTVESSNTIYSNLSTGISTTTNATSRTYIERYPDNRNLEDKLYKIRYVLPSDSDIKARPPLEGYIIQDSTSLPESDTEIGYQYSPSLSTKSLDSTTQLRSTRFISNASWDSNYATITTELPHNLSVGSKVEIINVLSSNNSSGISTSGYNGSFVVSEVTGRKSFKYSLTNNPGTFLDNTSTRTRNLPYFNRRQYTGTYLIYKVEEIQEYIFGQQDGIYHLTVTNSSTSPLVAPFTDIKLSQPVQNLYPQFDRDNPNSDPGPSRTFALPDPIGQTIVNNPEKSLTKETLENVLFDNSVGFALTSITSVPSGTTHTLYSSYDHGLNPVTTLSITNPGSNYGTVSGVVERLYNARLVGFAGSSTGEGATAAIEINTSGEITKIEIIDGGSSYGIGNTLSVVGIATTTNHVPAVVTVVRTYDHVGEVLSVSGIENENYINYNTEYEIVGISSRAITVTSLDAISNPSNIPQNILTKTNVSLIGKSTPISSFVYDNISGIATFTTPSFHGINAFDKVKVRGADSSLFNGDFIVNSVVDQLNFELRIGSNPSSPVTTGIVTAYPSGNSSSGGDNFGTEENRIISQYGGASSTLISGMTTTSTSLQINNISYFPVTIGDYLQIGSEIVRVRDTVSGNPLNVFRGVLGTRNQVHSTGDFIKKINPIPVEFRRHSILRASGHTFEYVGFGPGNYSNSLPERQDRQISEQEELISQSLKVNGGINVYTGMNNDGDFYIGNKRINSGTGQETVFDTPVPTTRGEEIDIESGSLVNITNTQEITATRSINVDGGKDKNIISKFDGPVVFSNKITSSSIRGIEANSIYIQGNATISRKYSVGISTPAISGTSGDIEFYSEPLDYLGWVYTRDSVWRKFGPVQDSDGRWSGIFTGTYYGNFIGDGSAISGLDPIWKTTATGIHTEVSVGIGTTQASASYKLDIFGDTNVDGILNVGEIIERLTVDPNTILGNPFTSATTNIDLKSNNVYYYTFPATANWTFNFRGNSTTSLNNFMKVGETITVALLTTQSTTAYYNTDVQIDGTTITHYEYGGFPISEGNPNGIDMYTFTIIKKTDVGGVDTNFTVLRSLSQYTTV